MELLELFKRQLASTPNTSSKNTIKNYVSDVRHFISWFEAVTASKFEASSITPDVILLYQNSMGGLLLDGQLQINSQLSAASMKRHLSSIRKFFTVLEGENILRENPFKKIVTEETVEPTDYWHLKSFRDYLMMGKASKITVKNYLSDISGFARWYEEAVLPTVENPVSSNQGFYLITQAIVEDYRKRLVEIQNAAPRTINRKLSALRRYLEFATKKGFITNREINISSVEAEIAQEVQDLPKVPLSEISTQLTPQKRMYSKIPPVRLVQKLFVNPYLLLEEGAANAITTFLIGKKVTGIANLPQKLSAQIVAKNALRVQNQGLSTLLSVRNIEKEFYAPEKISLSGLPIHQKLFHHVRFNRPNWYKRYHNYAFVHYIHFALLVIFASGVGVALYQNLVVQKQTPTFAAATAPPRILSFQGRLTDALDNPITSPQPVRFMIYNSLAATGAAELWEETRTISPDQDGIFSVLLGSDSTGANASSCGSFPPGSPYNTACLIPSTVFSDNSQIWLGVTIANSTELAPRQKIATVGYASNSEFLQGLPPTSAVSSFVNAVLALDSTGSFNLNDGIEHTFQVSNGTLTLKAQTLNLTTSLGTNGNIILNPEGSGKVDIQKPIINNSNTGNLVPGGVEINDKFGVLATESAVAAFIVNNNTTGGDIFAASSSGTTRFKIANDGSITSGFYTGQNAVLYGTQTTGVIGQVTTASTGLCLQSGASLPTWGTCGTSYWNLTTDNGALTPFSSTLDLLIGGQSTASAKFAFINNASGSPTASISGNLSIAVPTGANGANLFNIFNGGSLNFQTSGGGNAGLTSRLFIANDGRIGIGTTSPFIRNALDIRGLSGTSSTASISATSSYATLVVDNAGSGDLIAASASGVPNFVVKNNGDIIVGPGGGGKITAAIIDPYLIQNQKTTGIQSLTFQTLGASNADFVFQNTSTTLSTLTMAGQFQLPITGSTGGIVLGGDTQLFRGAADRIDIAANDSLNFLSGSGGLLTNGTTRIDASGNGTFANINITGTCTGCITTGNSPFYVSEGTIVPGNTTEDFILGGTASSSARFIVNGLATGIAPTASISATNGNGIYLSAQNSTVQTLRNNTLSIGGNTTGAVAINPLATNFTGVGTSNPMASLDIRGSLGIIGGGTLAVASISGRTSYAALAIDNLNTAGDLFTASSSSNMQFVIKNNGFVGFATAAPTARLDVNGSASISSALTFRTGSGTIQTSASNSLTIGGNTTGFITIDSGSGLVNILDNTNISGALTGLTGLTLASGGITLGGTVGTGTQCLLGGATASWGSCGSGGTSPFQYTTSPTGAIIPINSTVDFLIGGQATESAKFSILNIAGGTPTASISANSGNNAVYLTGDGTLATTNRRTLTIGNSSTYDTTGNVLINPNGTGNVGIGTNTSTVKLEIVDNNGTGGILLNGPVNDTANIRFRNTNQTPSDFNIDYAGATLRFFTETGLGTGGVYRGGITNNGLFGLGVSVPSSELHVSRLLTQQTATGKALVLFDQNENQDIFTASASGTTRFVIQNDGDVGIGTDSPLAPLHLSGSSRSIYLSDAGQSISSQWFLSPGANNYLNGTAAGDGGIKFHSTTGSFVIGRDTGSVEFKITNTGNLGLGTYYSPTGVNPTAKLQVYSLGTTPVASISGKTSGPTLLLSNDGTGDILAASVSGVQKFRINAAGDLIVGDGSGKIYGGGFDPLFTIDGKKFSTYASGINGMKEEYIGSANLAYDAAAGGYAYTLDFNNFEYGSELWTFSRVIDPDLTKVNVLLTPTSQARTWFRRDPVNRKLILYSDRPTSVTFRFTAPRFDYALYPSSNHSHDIAGLQAPVAPNTIGTGEADPMDSFLASLSIQFNNGLFVVLDGFGNMVHRVDGFSNLIAANLEAGFIHTRNLAADTLSAGSASLGNATANTFAVAANTITIGGKDIRQFIIDTVTAAGFGQNTIISPLAEVETIKTNTIRPLADGGDITVKGKLITESDKSATDSASISLDVRGSASISGNLTVNNIQTNNATLAGSLTTTNASISGTLAARDINVNQLQIRDNLKVGTVRADFGIFEQGITSMGPVTANILTATDQLAVGSNFTISNNAINTVGTDLAIQSLRQGDIAFQGGLIRMDTDGNMTVNGNFNLLGEIDAVHGVFSGTLTTPALATDLISPVADSNISLSFKDSKFNIQNSKTATGSAVLSIDNKGNIQSSGSATFAKLNFNLVGKAEATSLTEAVATGSAGFATLRAGQPELTIKNRIITPKSLIYITPFGNTDNKVLYLLRQIPDSDTEDGSFTIGISGQVPNHDIQFNWLVVN